nr:acyltransferase [Verruciconidia persicina]
MTSPTVHLPGGQVFTIHANDNALEFQAQDQKNSSSPSSGTFPFRWAVTIRAASPPGHGENGHGPDLGLSGQNGVHQEAKHAIPRIFDKPSLQDDAISIVSASSSGSGQGESEEAPTARCMAFMLWVTLSWYFQQEAPVPYLDTAATKNTPVEARPRGQWRVHVNNDGIVQSRNAMPALERIWLIAVGEGSGDADGADLWNNAFVSRQAFWQISAATFQDILNPALSALTHSSSTVNGISHTHASALPSFGGSFPLQYTTTNEIRHPLRQKKPQMGEVFYSRYVPAEGKYLSFRAASLSPQAVPYAGPVGSRSFHEEHAQLRSLSDTQLMKSWLSKPRVSAFWGEYHDNFLSDVFKLRHSFSVIGMWDGVPFGYFEIYWVKEDGLGRQMGSLVGDFDRGLHVFVGEDWARGRALVWISSLVHWCWLADNRTMNVLLEPRVDNDRFVGLLQKAGFSLDGQVSFPHKQSWVCRLRREHWEAPAI